MTDRVPLGAIVVGSALAVAIGYSAVVAAPSAAAADPVHGSDSTTTDTCAVCHRSHSAPSTNLVSQRGDTSRLCFTCHDGTGAVDVKSRFTTTDLPDNDPAGRAYYGHNLAGAGGHRQASQDEFGGVSNRHAECVDCHNPHRSAAGAQAGTSGVSVVNGPAGSAPSYTFGDGVTTPVALEYQLCFKCHSGYTMLPSNDGLPPSRHLLDKGVEFNPNNPSYHPVESAGRNQTPAMAASLTGPSPYRRWTLTPASTIRCTNCHADDNAGAGQPAGGGAMPVHRSANRGILLANYRDRELKRANEPYAAADFALCYLCHAEAPFRSGSSTATNFRLHAKHVAGISDEGAGGTDIDTAGAGQGNALCAECHYRIHSVSYRVGSQIVSGARLVNFAPDVTDRAGAPSWTAGAASGGSCTLTCHGERHDGERY